MSGLAGAVDYWCNAFLPDREAEWERMIRDQQLTLKVTRPGDGFCSADAMVSRMDAAGFATLVLPTCDPPVDPPPDAFEVVATHTDEIRELHGAHPSRFAGLWSIDPGTGEAGPARAREIAAEPWCVGLHTHTHSFDRPFDHPDYVPYYGVCAEQGLPFVMQAGESGGHFPGACGRPEAIADPARTFPDVAFVLSHTGAPWTAETIAQAARHPNVFVGTASWPPRRWPAELVHFLSGDGRGKVLYGSGFPTTGHSRVAEQLAQLGLDPESVSELTVEVAHRVFPGLDALSSTPRGA